MYEELSGDVYDESGISFRMLMEHPVIQDCVNKFTRFKQVVSVATVQQVYISLGVIV